MSGSQDGAPFAFIAADNAACGGLLRDKTTQAAKEWMVLRDRGRNMSFYKPVTTTGTRFFNHIKNW